MTLWTDLAGSDIEVHYVTVGPWRTRVLERGSGPVLIILAWHRRSRGGLRQEPPYARRPVAGRLYDLPGHGWSTLTEHDLEIQDYIDHLIGLMDALGVEKAYLSGESLGGWVLAKFAAAHPERVRGLILNTPGGTMANPEIMERIRSLSQAAADDPSPERIRARLEWLMADPASVTDELVDVRRAIYSRPGFPASMAHLLCMQDPEIRRRNLLTDEELAMVAAPTVVVWTTDDPSGPPEAGIELAEKIPGASFELIEHAGHWPQWEQQDEFDRIVLDFVAQVER